MTQPLTQQHKSIRHRKPLQSDQLHQYTRSVRVRAWKHKAEDEGVQSYDVETVRRWGIQSSDKNWEYDDGCAADHEADCVGLCYVDPFEVTHPSESHL